MKWSPDKGRTQIGYGNAQPVERTLAGVVPSGPSHRTAKSFSVTAGLDEPSGVEKSLRGFNSVPRERAGVHRVGVPQRSGSRHLTSSFGINELMHSSAAEAVAVPLPTGSPGRVGVHRVGVRDSPAAQGATDRREGATEQPGTWVRCGGGRGAVYILHLRESNPQNVENGRMKGLGGGSL
jgi:hypothetical protein